MKFTRIQIQRFGPLTQIDSGTDSLPGLVAVLGPNEAGKSAFHQVLGAALYGIYPATKDQNPFAPWNGEDIEIRAEIEVDAGERMEVRRRLPRTPTGQVIRGDAVEKLANRSLPVAVHIDRRVFSEVYAITLAQLTGLHEAAWETVQEQLIVGMGAQDLRSARGVMRSLRESAKKLWQPANRGKQRHRELRTEFAQLAQDRRQGEARDKEVRGLDGELSELRVRLEELRKQRSAAATRVDVIKELLPLRNRLSRLDDLEERLGDQEALAAAPRDPGARDRELRDRLERSQQRIDELTKTLGEVKASAGSLTVTELSMLERGSGLRALCGSAPLVHERISRRSSLEKEISALEGGIREAALPLLGVSRFEGVESDTGEVKPVDWSAAAEPFRSLQMSALRQRAGEAEDARRSHEDLEERIQGVKERSPARTPVISFWAGLLVLVSVATLVGGILFADPIVLGFAVFLLILAGGALVQGWTRWSVVRQIRGSGMEELEELEGRLSDADADERRGVASARELLIPLGLRAAHLDVPNGAVVSDIEELKNLFHRRHDRRIELTRLADEEVVFEEEFARLVLSLNLELPDDRSLALMELGRKLQDLEERRIRVEEMQSEEGRLDAALAREQLEHEDSLELRRTFEESITQTGGTVDEAGLRALTDRLADLELFTGLRAELEEGVDDLEDLRKRIEATEGTGEDWSEDPDRLTEEQTRIAAIDEEERELRERIGELQEREEGILEEDTVDLVDGQILHLRSMLRDVERERDRKTVLAQLVERVESRFRSEHQPDLLRRAEEHLSAITAERYDRILVGKIGEERGFFLDATHLPEPTPVAPPLSMGTREQVYLALRLAIVEHLDNDAETLPLLLDEVLVNWDPDRRARVLDLLVGLAPSRQIFVFTCHPHIAEEVTARGGTVVPLSPILET